MKLTAIAVAALLAVSAMPAAAKEKRTENTDSTAAAAASVLLPYLTPMTHPDAFDSKARSEYIAGLRRGMAATDNDPQIAGLLEGAELRKRLATLRNMGLEIDTEAFIAAVGGAVSGRPTGFTAKEGERYISGKLGLHSAPDRVSESSQSEYLSRMSAEPGAVVLPGGLVIQTVTEGDGNRPIDGDVVSVTYVGTLSDGTVFDDTEGDTVELPLDRVVPGMAEGLKQMRDGGHYRLHIPASLAYGADGIAGVIPGNAALTFDLVIRAIRHE